MKVERNQETFEKSDITAERLLVFKLLLEHIAHTYLPFLSQPFLY